MRVRGVKRYRHPKTGIWYCYHRATGTRILADYGSQAFFDEFQRIEAGKLSEGTARSPRHAGTLEAVLVQYKDSDAFTRLAPRTRSDYKKCFSFLKPIWHVPVKSFTAPQIVALRAKWRKERGVRTVNYVLSILSILMVQAIEMGLINSNPLRDVKKIRKADDGVTQNRAWQLHERKAVLDAAPPHLKVPIVLGMFYGMREGDVLALPRQILSTGEIKVLTNKRKVPICLPIFRELNSAVERNDAALLLRNIHATADAPLCLNSKGGAWTMCGFISSFQKFRKKLEAEGAVSPGLTFHGLRHTVATVLAEAGVEAETIAAWLGQRSTAMAMHYSREAKRHRQVRAVLGKFNPLGANAPDE